jgi:hypothetical protein
MAGVQISGDTSVTLKLDKFDITQKNIREGVANGIEALAFAIQEQAQQNIQDVGAIDTGAMRSSVYTKTRHSDSRDKAIADAVAMGKSSTAKSPKGHAVPIAGEGTQIDGDLEAKVGVGVEYGIYVEMGTGSMGARPFLIPAALELGQKADQVIGGYVMEELH